MRSHKTPILGYVHLNMGLLCSESKQTLTFAVVKDHSLPCCLILGANFLHVIDVTLDCNKQKLLLNNSKVIYEDTIAIFNYLREKEYKLCTSQLLVRLSDSSDNDVDDTNSEMNLEDNHNNTTETNSVEEPDVTPRFVISHDQLILMQNNYAISNLKRVVLKCILPKLWNIPALKQF